MYQAERSLVEDRDQYEHSITLERTLDRHSKLTQTPYRECSIGWMLSVFKT